MTDERETREQESADPGTDPASNLPTPAGDHSATTSLAGGNGSEGEGQAAEPAPAPTDEAGESHQATETRSPRADDTDPSVPEEAEPAPAEAPGSAPTEVAAEAEPEPEPTPLAAEAVAATAEPAPAPMATEPAPPIEEPEPAPAAAETTPPTEESTEDASSATEDASSRPEAADSVSASASDSPETVPDDPAPPEAAGDEAAAPAPAAATAVAAPAVPAAPEAPEDPALAELRRAKEEGSTVEGKVIGWNRGGFHVVVGEITAFCPSSEMEIGRPRNPQSYVDRTMSFRVVKFQKKGRRVVLSRAAILGEERQKVVGELEPGAVVRGTVTSLPEFGAFIDLGGVEGLVHVSEISRGRVTSPKQALKVGQEVEVKVLKVEKDGERISLSMKDLEPDPWQGVAERFPRGDKFPGKIMRRADFGLFVELEPEVEGLIHVSQLPPGMELGNPSLDPGTEVEVWVREVDRKRQRISLSLREVPTEDPWKEAAKRFPEGEMVDGTVESIAPFGVFVNLAPGLTGLLPGSQTGLPKGTSAARAFSPGQTVRVQVLSIDPRRKRISLGREGSRVEATRTDLQDFRKQQRDREQDAPTAMAAAFARLRGDGDGD